MFLLTFWKERRRFFRIPDPADSGIARIIGWLFCVVSLLYWSHSWGKLVDFFQKSHFVIVPDRSRPASISIGTEQLHLRKKRDWAFVSNKWKIIYFELNSIYNEQINGVVFTLVMWTNLLLNSIDSLEFVIVCIAKWQELIWPQVNERTLPSIWGFLSPWSHSQNKLWRESMMYFDQITWEWDYFVNGCNLLCDKSTGFCQTTDVRCHPIKFTSLTRLESLIIHTVDEH